MRSLSTAMEYWSKGTMKALFCEHEVKIDFKNNILTSFVLGLLRRSWLPPWIDEAFLGQAHPLSKYLPYQISKYVYRWHHGSWRICQKHNAWKMQSWHRTWTNIFSVNIHHGSWCNIWGAHYRKAGHARVQKNVCYCSHIYLLCYELRHGLSENGEKIECWRCLTNTYATKWVPVSENDWNI